MMGKARDQAMKRALRRPGVLGAAASEALNGASDGA